MTTTTMHTTYRIHETRAKMPSSCWGASHYVRIRVLSSDDKCLLDRDRVHDGSTERCEAARVRREASALLARLERAELMRQLALVEGLVSARSARLDGDAVAVGATQRLLTRYDLAWKKTGVALRMPSDLREKFGQWEHGKTEAACRAEIAHKRVVLAAEKSAAEEAHKREQIARHESRKIHLMTVLCPRLRDSYDHARAAGMCDTGIRSYCAAHGIVVEAGATAGELRALIRATGDTRPMRAIETAARAALTAEAS